jgi:hypothetical protein
MCSGSFRDDSMDCIRREMEDVDMCSVIGIFHSIGGGTGSGLGTKITEEIRDEVVIGTITHVLTSPDVILTDSLCVARVVREFVCVERGGHALSLWRGGGAALQLSALSCKGGSRFRLYHVI